MATLTPCDFTDFDGLRQQLKGPQYRDRYLMPYINLEDLSSPKNLLYFLDSRTREGPEYFAWSDLAPCSMAYTMEAFQAREAYGYTMRLSGQKTRATYGSLIAWVDDPSSLDDLYLGFGSDLGSGLELLKIQAKLYHFLLQCTEILLQDYDLSAAALDSPSNAPVEDSITTTDPPEWRTISEMNAVAAYCLPQQFDLDTLQKLATARREEAEEVFWALREDPAFFQEKVQEFFGHDMGPSTIFRRDSGFRPSSGLNGKIWCDTHRRLIKTTCRNLVLWDTVLEDLSELGKLRAKHATEIRPSKRLPREFEQALERFTCMATTVSLYARGDLSKGVTSCTSFHDYYTYEERWAGKQLKVDIVLKKDQKKPLPPILKLLIDFNESEKSVMMGALNILDEMERILSSDASQRAMITTGLARQISEIAAYAQIHDTLTQHQPTILNCDDQVVVAKAKKRLHLIDFIGDQVEKMKLETYIKPDSHLDYPIDKKKSQQNVEKIRAEEAKLDAFWAQIDDYFHKNTGKTIMEWMGARLTAREIQRTQPWQPPAKPSKQKSVTAPVGELPESYKLSSSSTPDKPKKLPTESKIKPKTRGQPDSSKESLDSIQSADASQDVEMPVQTFTLGSRPFKTMCAFFPTSNEDRIPGKVVWKDFLHAMYRLDFQIQKRHGSEWYFEPTWKRDAHITIHESHPSNEIPFSKLRFEANRLGRKYGWTSGTFQLG